MVDDNQAMTPTVKANMILGQACMFVLLSSVPDRSEFPCLRFLSGTQEHD